ncbi:MAG TPA: YfiR family protein [Planctomycetota bacterium]|nr:YfiR family protein [Planctomycetota bacterium]
MLAWMRRRIADCWFGVVLITATSIPILGQGEAIAAPAASMLATVSDEFSIKAAFLFNFAHYVKWPKSGFESADAPLIVAVFGKNPFDKVLENAFKGKLVDEHPLLVVYFESRAELKNCHMIYVPESEFSDLDRICDNYKDHPVLIVSESIAAAEQGAQVGFYAEKSKVRFAINELAAKAARLEVSSELLKLAKIVKTPATAIE